MNEGKAWRQFITIWVAALCVTAVVCCWLNRSNRYVPVTKPLNYRHLIFDSVTGNYLPEG
jgi:hypothetical protein